MHHNWNIILWLLSRCFIQDFLFTFRIIIKPVIILVKPEFSKKLFTGYVVINYISIELTLKAACNLASHARFNESLHTLISEPLVTVLFENIVCGLVSGSSRSRLNQ